MRYYEHQSNYSASRTATLLLVTALHVIGLYVFAKATSFSFVAPVMTVLQTKFIPVDPPKPEELPPPSTSAPHLETTLIQLIPPDIRVETPPAPSPTQDIKEKIVNVSSSPVVDEPVGPITLPVRISSPHSADVYPGKSVNNRESGRTELKVCISTTGIVDSAEVTKSSGYPRLDNTAVEMALDTRFKPAMRFTKPVAYCMLTGIRFSLN